MMLTDLQKAFDTIIHGIRLDKLHGVPFSTKPNACFESYITDQTFWVNINNCFSNLSKMLENVVFHKDQF